jgi:uncharacterized membrane protein YraQ (UPF0718 family)
MGENKDYDPGVSRRLELVQKQFRANAAEQKKQEAREKRRELRENLSQNRSLIGRIAAYAVMGALLLAIIYTVIQVNN